jgi:hypothetical protein
MKLGRIYGDRYVLKYLPDPKRAVLWAFGSDSIGFGSPFIGRPYVVTHRCDRCRVQLIDEAENESTISPRNT